MTICKMISYMEWYDTSKKVNFTVSEPQPYNKIGDGPEGPEVAITARELNKELQGKVLTSMWMGPRAKHKNLDSLVLPCMFHSVSSHGKRIIFVMNDFDGRIFYICSFLGMEGHWGWERPSNHLHLILSISSHDATNNVFLHEKELYFNDTRYFGKNVLIRTQAESDKFFKNVGIDLLKNPEMITPTMWKSKLCNGRISKMQVCKFLMEQKYFSGVGNYLKSEILYRARIKPDRTLGSLSEDEIENLRVHTLQTIAESYQQGGLTISTFYTPSGKTGNFVIHVYNRDTDCHGHMVQKDTFSDGRTTHWVPILQK